MLQVASRRRRTGGIMAPFLRHGPRSPIYATRLESAHAVYKQARHSLLTLPIGRYQTGSLWPTVLLPFPLLPAFGQRLSEC